MIEQLRKMAVLRRDHPFLVHEDQTVTYGEFDSRTSSLANALLEQGIAKGDRVALGMGNSIEYVVAAYAVHKTGAILNPINPGLGASALAYIMAHAAPRLVITDAEFAETLRPVVAGLPESADLAGFGDVAGALDLSALAASAPSADPGIEMKPSDPAMLMYTSGTTGNPKGVIHPHGMRCWTALPFVELLGIREDDVILAVTPLFHANGWGGISTALHAGATAAFPRRFRGSQFWPLVHETGATVFFTLGTVLAMLLTREPSEIERTSALRLIVGIGSAPIRDQLKERFGVGDVAENFGSTDAGCVTMTPIGEPLRPGSAGKAVRQVRVQIQDDEGRSLPPGEIGEIAVSAPDPRVEYFRAPEVTAAAYRGEWFLTGDLGRLDEDGWLYFVDRKQDFIRHRSENVSSAWVENILREHPRVVEAAVIGIPHEVFGQEIMAFIVADGEVSEAELHAFASERLAKFEIPHYWQFRGELPKTPSQRVQKYKLREEVGAVGKKLLG